MSCLVMNTETRVPPLQSYTTVKPLPSTFISDPLPVSSVAIGSNQSTVAQGSFSSKSSVLPGFKNTMKPVLSEEQPVKMDVASKSVNSFFFWLHSKLIVFVRIISRLHKSHIFSPPPYIENHFFSGFSAEPPRRKNATEGCIFSS